MDVHTNRKMRERYDDIVDAICVWHEEARSSKLFSTPCVKRSGAFVFGLGRGGMVFKLTDPAAHERALGEWQALACEALRQDHGIAPEGTRTTG